MDDNFLYFLGAGASCNVLPLSSNFTEGLFSFANELQKIGPRNVYSEPNKQEWDKPFNNQIFRINGYCGTHPPGHVGDAFKSIWRSSGKSVWNTGLDLFNKYMSSSEAPDPDIRFAWELSTMQRINLDLSEISTVVVIGYSFPYFNREVDHFIFS